MPCFHGTYRRRVRQIAIQQKKEVNVKYIRRCQGLMGKMKQEDWAGEKLVFQFPIRRWGAGVVSLTG